MNVKTRRIKGTCKKKIIPQREIQQDLAKPHYSTTRMTAVAFSLSIVGLLYYE